MIFFSFIFYFFYLFCFFFFFFFFFLFFFFFFFFNDTATTEIYTLSLHDALPIIETQGAADAAHDWPAQRLLDYGNAVLDSLRPAMIYVGGTDPGCFIPTMLNDTSDGERHVVLTQNALADNTYLEYLGFLYGDQMTTLTRDDSQRAFQKYITDAEKRLQHDQQFPNEPKQVRPGEDIKMIENRVQVSGQVAVMAINEQNALTRERAAQSLDYWRTTAQQIAADPEAADSPDVRKTYSKMADDQAALFLDRQYTAEAEQGFQLAIEICPYSPEAVFRYVNLLTGQNRLADAVAVTESAVKAAPDYTQFRDLLEQLRKAKK